MTKTYRICEIDGKLSAIDEDEPAVISRLNATIVGSGMVIVSQDKTLGVPLLPNVNNWEEALSKEGLFYVAERIAFVKGFNANAKKYTEDDMLSFGEFMQQRSTGVKESFDIFPKKLNSIPTHVELEMEDWYYLDDDRWHNNYTPRNHEDMVSKNRHMLKLKVKDGFVVVKRWIYV